MLEYRIRRRLEKCSKTRQSTPATGIRQLSVPGGATGDEKRSTLSSHASKPQRVRSSAVGGEGELRGVSVCKSGADNISSVMERNRLGRTVCVGASC